MKKVLVYFSLLSFTVACSNPVSPVQSSQINYVSGAYRGASDIKISHGFLILGALNALKTNKLQIRNTTALEEILQRETNLTYGGDMPDADERDEVGYLIPTMRGHFYNPHTYTNYMGGKDLTAFTRFIEHTNKAKQAYIENDLSKMVEQLGRATHYLADVCVPYHATNAVAIVTYHMQYEKFVNELMRGQPETYTLKNLNLLAGNSYAQLLHNSALKSYDLYKDASSIKEIKELDDNGNFVVSHVPDLEKWQEVADVMLPYTQQAIATYLEMFASEMN